MKTALLLALLSAPALAASPTDAVLEWDAHPQADIVTRFVAACCPPSGCAPSGYAPFTVSGGNSTRMPIAFPATEPGSITCTLTACNDELCSPPSNAVIWERPSTGAPPNLRVEP